MRAVYLIGFMGSGKTSVSKVLAEKLSTNAVDTDDLVIKKTGKKITDIFKEEGEAKFRDYETQVLTQLSDKNKVVATGGGIVEREENNVWMKQNGFVIYLHTTWEEIIDRLRNDETRPLWKKKEENKKQLFNTRNFSYISASDATVYTDNKSPEKIAEEIIKLIENR